MRHWKALAIIGTGAVATNADANSGCSSLSTVYITVPGSPITETFYAASNGASVAGGKSVTKDGPVTSEAFTVTVTNPIITTQVISVVQASPASVSKDQGPYSFFENNGTTIWLGGETPPASISFDIATSYVTLEPVPMSREVSAGGGAQTTPYLITSSTHKLKKTLTETLAASTVPTSGKAYSGLGSSGWNTTTLVTSKSEATGSGLAKPTVVPSDKHTSIHATGHPKKHSTRFLKRRLEGRNLGDIVVATVDGVAVSWFNSYAGTTPTSSVSQAASTSRFAVPIYPWDLNPPASPTSAAPSTPVPTSSPSPTVVLPIYPWDPSPASSPSAISIVSSPLTSSQSMVPTQTTVTASGVPTSASIYSNTSTSLSASAAAGSPSCSGSSALFTVTFDDLPHFSVSSDSGNTDIPPIFNPYRKLYWQDHFGYVPPPSDPFPPISPPQLAVYRSAGTAVDGSPGAGLESSGEIGAGPRASDSAYWVDANSAWLGCSDGGPTECTITINGYTQGSSQSSTSQTVIQPPCPGLKNCSLALVEFNGDFKSLSGLQITAAVAGKPVDYYMDDLSLTWSNSTCTAQQDRSSAE